MNEVGRPMCLKHGSHTLDPCALDLARTIYSEELVKRKAQEGQKEERDVSVEDAAERSQREIQVWASKNEGVEKCDEETSKMVRSCKVRKKPCKVKNILVLQNEQFAREMT